MDNLVSRLTNKDSEGYAQKGADLFSSLPHLPKNITEFLVNFAPIFALIGAVLSLIAGPILGLLSVISLISLNPFFVLSVLIAAVITLLSSVILFLAYKPLQNRQYRGWLLLWWSMVLSAIQAVLDIGLRQEGVFSLIGIVIGFYVLYEMRPFYGVKGKLGDATAKAKDALSE